MKPEPECCRAVVAAALWLLLISCAELRLQPVIRTTWLSKAGDPASLAELKLLDRNKATAGSGSGFVQIESGSEVYSTIYSSQRCSGRRVFQKVQVKTGSQKGVEGWMCGGSISHSSRAAL